MLFMKRNGLEKIESVNPFLTNNTLKLRHLLNEKAYTWLLLVLLQVLQDTCI